MIKIYTTKTNVAIFETKSLKYFILLGGLSGWIGSKCEGEWGRNKIKYLPRMRVNKTKEFSIK